MGPVSLKKKKNPGNQLTSTEGRPCIMDYIPPNPAPNSYTKDLTTNVTVFGNKVCKEVIKVKEIMSGGGVAKSIGLVLL